MTESDLAVRNGRRVLKTVVEPRQTIERVQEEVRELHEGIQAMLDGLKERYADKGAEMSELACEGEDSAAVAELQAGNRPTSEVVRDITDQERAATAANPGRHCLNPEWTPGAQRYWPICTPIS